MTVAKKKRAQKKTAAKRRSCRKGYVLKTVRVKRKGRTARVKRCRKRQVAAKKKVAPPPAAPVKPPTVPGIPPPLFDPPGSKLEGEAAKTYIERYLHGSRFTDCPAGGCATERRYSHLTGGGFGYCALPAGTEPSIVSTFVFETGVVEADGAWTVDLVVTLSPRPALYHWMVATDGTVTGTYKIPGPTLAVQIPPLRYVAGTRDCGT